MFALTRPHALLAGRHGMLGSRRSFLSFPSIVSVAPSRLRRTSSLIFPIIHLPCRCFSRYSQDFYSVIGVTKRATQAEIKQAYFRKAKKYHPDLNPGDPTAVKKFQELATAYETLGNPQRRLEYDQLGYQQYSQQATRNQQQYGQPSPPDANEVFNEVYQDYDIIKSAWNDYLTETKEDWTYACKEADQGNWTPMYDLAKANSILLAGIVVPLVVVLRMPAAVGIAMRLISPIITSIITSIIYSGKSKVFARYLWKNLVEIARNRKKRRR